MEEAKSSPRSPKEIAEIDASKNKDNYLNHLILYPFAPLDNMKKRTICPKCKQSRKFYCPKCFVSFMPKELVPEITLPFNVIM